MADALPAGTQVGLRVYGSEIAEPKESNAKACRDTELVLPVGPLDRSRMYDAVDSFEAVGETPIAYSMEKAVGDLGEEGRRVLVLISDGEESCSGDPCPAARKLAAKGVDLQFDAIGVDVGRKARSQLRCIARAGDGSYYVADDADDLSEALRTITQRALRPFAITGKPVSGNEDPEQAPDLAVGEDCDAADFSNGTYDTTMVVAGAVVSGTGSDACLTEPLLLSVQRIARGGNDASAAVELVVSTEPEITNTVSLPGPVKSYRETGRR